MWIPHVYNGHDKTFFFFSYEGFRSVLPDPNSGTYHYGSECERSGRQFRGGHRRAQVTCGGGPCKDALGNPVLRGDRSSIRRIVAADGFTRFPFPNNTIPQSRMDQVALKIQSYLPKPTNGLQALNFQLVQELLRGLRTFPPSRSTTMSPQVLKLSTFYSYVGGSGQPAPTACPRTSPRPALIHRRRARRV